MKKKILILIPLFIFVLMFFLWQPAVVYFLDSGLKGYCQKYLKGEMTEEGIFKEDGKWVIERPTIRTSKREFLADRISIGVEIHPLSREIDVDLAVVNPEITIEKDASELKAFLAECIPQSLSTWVVNINSRVNIDNGVLHFGKDKSAQFQLHANSNAAGKEGKLVFDINEGGPGCNILEMSLLGNSVELNFYEVDCASFANAIQSFGIPLNGWSCSEGSLNGKMTLDMKKKKLHVMGEATLKGLAFEHQELNIRGEIREAHLDARTETLRSGERGVVGKLELTEEAAILFVNEGAPYWEMKKLLGGVYFQGKEIAVINLEGVCNHLGTSFGLNVEGDLRLLDQFQSSIDIGVQLISANDEIASARFVARQLGALCNCAEIEIKNIGKEEFTFVQTALGRYAPEWESFRMLSGSVNASGIAYMKGYRLTDIKIDHILASKLKYEVDPWEMTFGVNQTTGDFSISLEDEDPLESMMASFSIDGGKMKFLGINGKSWRFSNINTDLNIKNGVLEKSLMNGELAGLKGSVAIDWNAPDKVVQVNFNGSAKELAALMPEFLMSGIEREFGEDHLTLAAEMSQGREEKSVEGVVTIIGGNSDDVDSISFGFDLEKKVGEPSLKSPIEQIQALKEVVPTLSYGEGNIVSAEHGIAGYCIRNGWFKGRNLPLNKYVSPFIFPNDEMKLSGRGNFKGYIDNNQLAVEYDGSDVALENDELKISLDKISKVYNHKMESTQYPAHYINFNQGTHFGTIPIKNGTYYDKNSGLEFSGIGAYITLEGEEIHLNDFEGAYREIVLAGDVDIDFGKPDDDIFDVDFRVNQLKGNVSQVKELLNKYDPTLALLKIPLEGELFFGKRGAHLHLSFTPEDYSVKAEVDGGLKGGILQLEDGNEVLRDLTLNFAYDHGKSYLEFTHIHAKLPFEKEYTLTGDRILFSDLSKSEGKFDLWIGERNRDWVRIVGRVSGFDPERMLIDFNDVNTHFGEMNPGNFKMIIRNWDELERITLNAQLNLQALYHESQILVQAFDFPLLQKIPALSGDVNLDFSYDTLRGDTKIDLLGDNVKIGEYAVGPLSLKGVKKDDKWNVKSLSIGALKLSGELLSSNDELNIEKMKLRYGESLSMKLAGQFFPDEKTFNGKVKWMELDLGKLDEWDACQKFVEGWSPHGMIKGDGKISFALKEDELGWRADAILNTSIDDCELKGLKYENAKGVSCHFISDKGVTFRNIKSALQTREDRKSRTIIDLDRGEFSFITREFILDGLDFQVDAKHLSWFADTLYKSFPLTMTPKVVDVIKSIKTEGVVRGVYQLDVSPLKSIYRLSLEDSDYHFLNTIHSVKDFQLTVEPSRFIVKTQYGIGENYFWLNLQSLSPTLEYGETILTEKRFKKKPPENALQVNWLNDPEYGFLIDAAEGEFAGLTFDLVREQSLIPSAESIDLVGSVKINADKASCLLSKEFAEQCENWGVGDGYELTGEWQMLKNNPESSGMYFNGMLTGNTCAFKGYQWDALSAQLVCSPEVIHFHDFNVVDAAGNFHAEHMEFLMGEDEHWLLSLPTLKVTKLRPSILHVTGSPRPSVQTPFIIRELTLNDLYGSFSDTKTFGGKGEIHFTNRSKKSRHNTIFNVPAEILARIGLDLTAFNPVSGTVFYRLDDGQVLLTKCKDMYSERKLSKFYFPTNKRSTIDFDGTLNVKLRMKQYGLLFKLAQPFTVNIRGNLDEPSYKITTEPKSKKR